MFPQVKKILVNALIHLLPAVKRYGLLTTLILALLFSNHFLVQLTHQSRNQHVKLQKLEEEQTQLEAQWSQLLLEEGALSSPVRLERLAREELGLRLAEEQQFEIKALD